MSVFDQMKMAGMVAGLMKNQDRLKEIGERVKGELEALRVTGEAGGGVVKVVASGTMEVREVTLEPTMAANLGADEGSRAMSESLIRDATNEALRKARDEARKIVEREMGALGLPALPGLTNLLGAS